MIGIAIFFALSCAAKEPYPKISSLTECPTDDRGYEHIEKELSSYSNKNYYACNKNFKNTIEISENILLLYLCNFTNMLTNAVIITAIQTAPLQSIEIKNCNFYNTQGESIHLDVQKGERVVNIVECRFEKCKYSTNTKATAIYFKVSSGNIEKCTFMNNVNDPNVTHDIYYENYNDGEGTVKFNENNFIRKASQDPCGNLISFKSDSAFEFTNNIMSISPNSDSLLFSWPSDLTSTDKLKFENNKMFPYNLNAIANGGDFLKDKFELIEHDCPPADKVNFCENSFEFDTQAEIKHFVNIFYCTFFSITNTENEFGGAISISWGEDFPSKDEPIKIYNSDFVACSAVCGSAIYINCLQSSLVFDFVDCYFHSNTYTSQSPEGNGKKGGAIYINTKFTSFKFTSCSFDLNTADDGGAIYYSSDTTDSSEDTSNEENKYSLYLTDCKFNSNKGKSYGGALYISLIGKEHSKPIELESCIFYSNNVIDDTDGKEVKGGAIFYSYQSTQSSSTTLLETTNNYCFGIHNCKFSENEISNNGGAVSIIFSNTEPSKSVEISGCSFDKNIASKSVGADIYFNLDSQQDTGNTNELLIISDCSFTESKAKEKPGSIYADIKGVSKRTVEFNKCVFNTDGIHLISTSPSIYYHLNDCDFMASAYSYFDIISAKLENCHFNNMTDSPIHYKSTSTFSQNNEFRIEKCNFRQQAEINFLVYFDSKISSKFSFISNNIVILNHKTLTLGCSSDVTLDETGWDFQDNTINGKDELIKPSELNIPASCENGFICLADCDGQVRCDFDATTAIDEPKVELSKLTFDGLSYSDDGAAIHIYNYHIYCNESNFKDCKSEKGGDGAIYIYIDTNIESPIILELLNFENCAAIYGGAVFIFSDVEENNFQILNCTFIENSASKTPSTKGDVYYGGSAVFMTVKKNEIQFCKFKKNAGSGVKIFNDFEKMKKNKLSENDAFVLIENCIFEVDENSESSLFYLRGMNNEIPVEVKSCQFVGHLKDKSYHIDGTSLSDRKDAMKLKIESCQFSDGMESSINTKSSGLIFGSIENKEQQANDSNQKEINEKTISIKLISFVALGLACVIAIFAFFIHFGKKEDQETNKEQETTDL